MNRVVAIALLAALLTPVATARADDNPISEIRGGIMAHDVPLVSFNREDGVDLNAEVLFDSPDVLSAIRAPRPHLGATINTAGETSFAYTGLTWEWEPAQRLFFDAKLGGAVHNGELGNTNRNRKGMGSRVLFHLGLELGYRVTEQVSVSVMADHISNAYLTDPNHGLDTVGLRMGYRF